MNIEAVRMRGRPPGTRHTSRHGPAKRARAVIVPVILLLAGLLATADGRPQQISGRSLSDGVHGSRPEGGRRPRDRRLAEEPVQTWPSDPDKIGVVSALHDTEEGEIKVFMEVARQDNCNAMTTCSVRHKGSDWLQELKATPLAPFGVLSKDPQKRPELFECFVTVQLPAPNMSLSEIILHLDGSNRTVTALLEEIETLPYGKRKGLGMCVGPQFSETPFFADFLTWYLELGVDRFYMYAVQANWLLDWDPKYFHFPGSRHKLQLFHHHAIEWRLFHLEHASTHYYGQWLMYNDCVYRARNTMELVMFNDRDEFINVRQRHQRFNLKHFFLEHFDKPEIASLSYWHAIYHVHCKMDKLPVLDGLPGQPSTQNPEYSDMVMMKYWGYSAWEPDHREPNFTGCGSYQCHPKVVVRPKAVNVMNTHWIHLPMPGYTTLERRLSPRVVFGKHISCKSTGIYGGDWDENPDKMLCFEEELGPPVLDGSKPHYVYMCPQEEVDAYAAGSWPINRTLSPS